jgi:hypothetical protein
MLKRFHCPSVVIPLTEVKWGVFLSGVLPSSASSREPVHPFPSPIFHSTLAHFEAAVTT